MDLLLIGLDPGLSHHKNEKSLQCHFKGVFAQIELHIVLSQSPKDLEINHMLINMMAFHQHIINIDLLVIADLILEDYIDKLLVCSSYILQLEGHDFIAIQSFFSDEGSLLLILEYYPNLIVAQ